MPIPYRLPSQKKSGFHYWTPSAILARLKDAKQSVNQEERSHPTPDCSENCVSELTCDPLQCAPDFHQCSCGSSIRLSYPCDAHECAQTTHHCQRYDCYSSDYSADYYQCSLGCLNSHTCFPNSCAPEFANCECLENRDEASTCDMDWCGLPAGTEYCDVNVCRSLAGVSVTNEPEIVVMIIAIYLYINIFTCCFCCCCCCQGWTWFGCCPAKNQGVTHTTVTTGPPVYPTQMQAVPQPDMQPVYVQPMMMAPMMQPQQAAAPINITIVNNNDNNNDNKSEKSHKGHHGEEH